MKNRVLLTAVSDDKGEFVYKDTKDTLNFLKQNGLQAYSVFWRDIDPGLVASKVYDVNNNDVLTDVNINEISDLFHLFELGKIHKDLDKLKLLINSFKESYQGIMINNPDTILDNMNKDYLLRLQDKGLAIPKTDKISTNIDLLFLKNKYSNNDKFIVKPWNGEAGNYVMKLSDLTEKIMEELKDVSPYLLIQEFIPEIKKGEKSLIYFGDKFSHAVLKVPPENSFLSNLCRSSSLFNYEPNDKELALGYKIPELWRTPTNAYRLDLVTVENNPVIIEVEMVNPGFFVDDSNFDLYSKNLLQFYETKLNR